MKRIFFACAIALLFSAEAMAQSSKVTSSIGYRNSGYLDKAKAAIDQASQHEKSMGEARTWMEYAQVYYALSVDTTGKYNEINEGAALKALEAVKKTFDLDQEKKKKYKDIANLSPFLQNRIYNLGLEAYNTENFKDAHKYFLAHYELGQLMHKVAPKQYEEDYESYFNAAIAADRADMGEEARTIYNKLIDVNYPDFQVYTRLASMEVAAGDNTKAENLYRSARTAFPENQDVLLEMLNFYLSQDRAPEVVTEFEQAIANDPENAQLRFAQGFAFQQMADKAKENGNIDEFNSLNEKAAESYKASVKLNPEDFAANLNIGKTFYDQIRNLDSEISALDLDDQANYDRLTAERKQMYQDALPYFEKAAELYDAGKAEGIPVDYGIQVWDFLREIYFKIGQPDKSKAAKERVAELKEGQ